MRSATFAPVLTAVMALLTGAPSWAGSADKSVAVTITLSQPGAVGATVTSVPPQPLQRAQRRRLLQPLAEREDRG